MTKKHQLAKSATMIAIFTLISKGLGFIREVLIASRYGSGLETDTYFVAMTATVMIMSTLGQAMNTTLIPIFSEIGEKKGKIYRLKYLNNILNLVFLVTLVLATLAFIFSPAIIKIIAKGFEGEQFDLAVKLNRIGVPIIIFLGFTHVLSGYLHSAQIFGPHAIMGIPYNLVFLIYLLFLPAKNIGMLMFISVIASSTQFLIQVPAVRHTGYRYSLNVNMNDPYVKKAVGLVFPVLIGSSVQQLSVIIDKTLASELATGSISALSYASRINDLIITVFIQAIATVVFPMLSSAFSRNDKGETINILNQGVNLILLITVPATVGLIILAYPMVQIFFQRGAFDDSASIMTSSALVYYSIGLVAIAVRVMLNKVFYSLQDTKTPMINGAIGVLIDVVLNFALVGPLGLRGLALSTSISAVVIVILALYNLRAKLGPIGIGNMLTALIKTSIASLVMGFVVYLIYNKVGILLSEGTIMQIIALLISIFVGIIVYFFMLLVLKMKEVRILTKAILRRI